MKKSLSCVVAVAMVLVMASSLYAKDPAQKKERKKPTPEEIFAKRDKDGNGSISLEEYIGKKKDGAADKAKTTFEKLDKNGDGQLCKDEAMRPPKKGKGKKKGDQ